MNRNLINFYAFCLRIFKNSTIQALNNSNPPMGVTGPMKLKSTPINELVVNK
jgi:hypothetical protein